MSQRPRRRRRLRRQPRPRASPTRRATLDSILTTWASALPFVRCRARTLTPAEERSGLNEGRLWLGEALGKGGGGGSGRRGADRVIGPASQGGWATLASTSRTRESAATLARPTRRCAASRARTPSLGGPPGPSSSAAATRAATSGSSARRSSASPSTYTSTRKVLLLPAALPAAAPNPCTQRRDVSVCAAPWLFLPPSAGPPQSPRPAARARRVLAEAAGAQHHAAQGPSRGAHDFPRGHASLAAQDVAVGRRDEDLGRRHPQVHPVDIRRPRARGRHGAERTRRRPVAEAMVRQVREDVRRVRRAHGAAAD